MSITHTILFYSLTTYQTLLILPDTVAERQQDGT